MNHSIEIPFKEIMTYWYYSVVILNIYVDYLIFLTMHVNECCVVLLPHKAFVCQAGLDIVCISVCLPHQLQLGVICASLIRQFCKFLM